MSFPSKAEREKCWTSRDVFWKCLDDHKGDPETMKACAEFRAIYETSCPSQWVKHFDRKREYLKFKDRIQKDGLIQPYDQVPQQAVTVILANDHGQTDSLSTTSCTTINLSNSNSCQDIQEASSSSNNSNSSTTEKCPSPNTRIYRKFQPPTFSYT